MTAYTPNRVTSVKWSIKWKIMAIMTVVMTCLVAVLSYLQISSQKAILEAELIRRIGLMTENLIERGRSFTGNLSQQVENDIASLNLSGAVAAVTEGVKNSDEIKYAILMDREGMVLVHTLQPALVQTELSSERARNALRLNGLEAIRYKEGGESVIEIAKPLQISTTPWGVLRLIYTLNPLNKEIETSRQEISQEIRRMVYKSILTAVAFMAVSFVIVFILSTRFSRPLITLTESARKLSKGDFSVSSDIPVRSRDELGVLGEAFMDMSRDLKESYRRLEEYSTTLEEKVAERTEKLHKSLNETAEARDRIDGILKSVADGLIVMDIHNRVILMNRAAEDLLGIRFSEVVNMPIDFAIEEKTLREKVTETLGKKSTGYFFDFHLAGKDPQHPRIMRARTSVTHDREGKETGIVMIMHDVTHEREVDRMKTEFISTAAHELRTPLTSIQGFSEILMTRNDLRPEEKNKFLFYINKQSKDLTNIINDLLDISRIESGRGFSLNKTFFNTSDTITGILPYFEEQYTNHCFRATLSEEPMELYADKEKVEQIIKNLLSNAAKYSPEGGVIRVTERRRNGDYEVTIEDEGIGMTNEQVEKIFDKFYRVDASDMAVEGTGLGMTIVKYIVEAHEGDIMVKSQAGKGTSVIFTIPLRSSTKEERGEEHDDTEESDDP